MKEGTKENVEEVRDISTSHCSRDLVGSESTEIG